MEHYGRESDHKSGGRLAFINKAVEYKQKQVRGFPIFISQIVAQNSQISIIV